MKILKYTMTGSSREFYGTGTNFFRYRYRYFFPGPIFSGTGTGTFFRDLIFPVPVLFSGTKFFRYRYRYHPKKEQNSRDRDVTLCSDHVVGWSNKLKFPMETNDWRCTVEPGLTGTRKLLVVTFLRQIFTLHCIIFIIFTALCIEIILIIFTALHRDPSHRNNK